MWVQFSAKWVVLWSLWAARLVPQPTTPVRVSSGLLRGVIHPGGDYAGYTGIPYAKVVERFKAAAPAPRWQGVLDAYDEHVRCTQRFSGNKVLGREDCLTVNVYTPLFPLQPTTPLPVMVFIHGGGFRDGSGSPFVYGPQYLVRHGVILVTFNYRLEVLGFLCLGTKEAPGNAGLKDQVEALKWVKENIKAFGGDPDNITIFGESAGSASVGYHLISRMSKGLFDRAIMQSGSAMSPWSINFEPLQTAKLLAQQMGHKTEDPHEIYNIFKAMTAENLMQTRVPRKKGDIVLSENIFVPCVEKDLDGVENFLPDTPYNLMVKGDYNKVPIIIGYNSAEGFMFVGKENDTVIPQIDFFEAMPRDLHIPGVTEKARIADVLRRYYMGDTIISKETLAEFARFEGDVGITYPVIITADILLKNNPNNPVYIYKFSYDGWLNLAKIVFGFGKHPGATHADELFYMFKIQVTLPMTFLEKAFINKMSELWTNFARYREPTPEPASPAEKWLPADKTSPHVFELDKTPSTSPLWADEIIRFWNTTYAKYRRKTSRW